MNIYSLQRKQFIAKPLSEVFQFFEKPENLGRITPPWLRFQIVSPSPIEMKAGTQINYRVRPLGFPMKWTSLIESYDPPRGFVDVQLKGPYAFWRHQHRFWEEGGGTWVEDHVDYALPLGFLGRIAHALKVKSQLMEIFDYRNSVITKLMS